jgi:hypothetical protein
LTTFDASTERLASARQQGLTITPQVASEQRESGALYLTIQARCHRASARRRFGTSFNKTSKTQAFQDSFQPLLTDHRGNHRNGDPPLNREVYVGQLPRTYFPPSLLAAQHGRR